MSLAPKYGVGCSCCRWWGSGLPWFLLLCCSCTAPHAYLRFWVLGSGLGGVGHKDKKTQGFGVIPVWLPVRDVTWSFSRSAHHVSCFLNIAFGSCFAANAFGACCQHCPTHVGGWVCWSGEVSSDHFHAQQVVGNAWFGPAQCANVSRLPLPP